MVFLVDEGSGFAAPVEAIWEFLGSGAPHSTAHAHRSIRRRRLGRRSGQYSWEQRFEGRWTRFTMHWTAFPPVGIAYRVVAGPFRGSTFFLYYRPRGRRTGVAIVGEFLSPTIPQARIPAEVDRFFTREFRQDAAALGRWVRARHAARRRAPRRHSPDRHGTLN